MRVLAAGETCALATIVEARGSTPQRAGASLLLRTGGSYTGTLGGGCIEAEAVDAAREALTSGAGCLLDFELTEDIAVDYGLACGGSERILIAPLTAAHAGVFRALQAAIDEWRPAAVLLSLDRPGAIAAIDAQGRVYGDTALAESVRIGVADLLAQAHARPVVLAASEGEVFVAPVGPPAEIVVVGAGHVGRAVATAAKFLSYRVVVIDDRDDFANRDRFPDADEVITDDIARAMMSHNASPASAIVIVTRGHKYDYQALAAALASRAYYVGLMGSRRKVALIFRQLIEDGIPPDRLRDVHAPIGLDIGATSPEEIALSIVAEITSERLGGNGAPMKVDPRIIAAAQARARR